uniref:TLC domain-containing protein n=1 Tax=Grammatophora oceanica TaxID=210454 RepID=A0A7S1VDC8_9STRA
METPTHDVGIAIALKRQDEQRTKHQPLRQKDEFARTSSPTGSEKATNRANDTTRRKRQRARPHQSRRRRRQQREPCWWKQFLQGAMLYFLCISLPTIGGMGWRWFSQTPVSEFLRPLWKLLDYRSAIPLLLTFAGRWTGIILLTILTLLFAIARITLVSLLISEQDNEASQKEKIEAIVRVRSVHLLSSAYPKSLTPSRGNSIANLAGLGDEALSRSLHENSTSNLVALNNDDGTPVGILKRPPSLTMLSGIYYEEDTPIIEEPLHREEPVQPSDENLHGDELDDAPSWVERSFEAVRRSSIRSLGVEDDDDVEVPVSTQQLPNQDTSQQTNSATRYATAVFRLIYCGMTCVGCWFMFSSLEFWPPAVGGRGATANCWDLRGGPVAIQDSSTKYFDFDNANALLKMYSLVQASYHLHSLAFHLLTMALLWYHRGQSTPITSYWRSLLQHGIALCLIGGSYLFSATRRLGAIGTFALDLSNFFLHLLQVLMNSPQKIDTILIHAVHKGLVIPFFVYCRFYVWPAIVWYSMARESKDWLAQVSHTIGDSVALALLMCFHLLTLALLILNMVMFKRLLFHPHLQRLSKEEKGENRTSQ